ncbi:MAG: serine/threonine protein kinase, partial [Actinobacteria bacterium]|nr:serine/threonine protein kinase [Actinomycetota bacterium]
MALVDTYDVVAEDWRELEIVEPLLSAIRIQAFATNEPIVIEHVPAELRVLGSGTDAIVVQHPSLPELAFKVYAPETVGCLVDEYDAYRQLAGSPYFAACLGRGDFYVVLSYEPGPTLYDCLVQGIPVPPQAMADVEAARNYARLVGLHPKDVHLKNVLLQGDRARILDVSKYIAPGDDDHVWELLAQGYRRIYPL